ncbi:MAG: hypothetical protein K9W46_05270 [Candidatus Heimdallarchaeum endolithica]|uniref:Peptidase A2 domain-containing protein n=1 Tax=Candidatus Heimdallarchaeum endolithica TaxID=2876572 RepID=A0A9Y1BT35_9ARCH|nr:MAG: hypothetical protein K9W46_05270 [Candidatus Heimdallarchaeum endolithica]
MKKSFKYQISSLTTMEGPYIPIKICDPLEKNSVQVLGLIDTGYEGDLIVPENIYEKLELKSYEFDEDSFCLGETISGDKITLKSASGSVYIKGFNISFIVTIDSHISCKEVLIGRKFLEPLYILLKGPEKEVEIEIRERELT